MTELTRSLLAAAREGLAPDHAVAARVRAKVAAAVGASAAATGSLAAMSAKPGASSALLLKLGGALLAVGIVATAIVVTRPDHTARPVAPRLSVAPSATDDLRNDVRVVAPSERLSERSLARMVESSSASHHETAGTLVPSEANPSEADSSELIEIDPIDSTEAATAKRRRTTQADDADAVSLAREVELIDLAIESLNKRAPHAALEAIKAYDRETHGRGQMAEDAAAIEIEARCNSNLDATDQIERFDRKWPESAQRERIQTACFAKP
jgi:hypothetical protein